MGGHGIVGVSNGDPTGKFGYFIALKPPGITLAVDTFMMLICAVRRFERNSRLVLEHLETDLRMLFDLIEFRFAQFGRFVQ
ncbi:hypothetical protein D3C73_1458230 [compost metagenome]